MQVSLIFKCSDLLNFIPVMYTHSDINIIVHVYANVI